jgi:phosphoribosylaminoimidazole (AIR) synthetase
VGKLIKQDIDKIITAINQACVNQDCCLVGGEISEQPGVLGEGIFVLSSTVVGVVSKKKIIDGSRIKKGDKVIALASNGLHTNGYSLVRKLITDKPAILNSKIDGKSFKRYPGFTESAWTGAYYRRWYLRQPRADSAGGFERAGTSGQDRSPAGFQGD